LSGAGAATTTTDSSGNYDFTGLAPGNYTVSETLQGTYVQTSPTSSTSVPPNVTVSSSGTPDTSGYTASYKVAVQAGFTDSGLNFGDRLKGDLSITKTDGVTSAVPGSSTTYTITVANTGPSTVTGAAVADTMPSAITSDTWTATATGGATGFSASGSGNI